MTVNLVNLSCEWYIWTFTAHRLLGFGLHRYFDILVGLQPVINFRSFRSANLSKPVFYTHSSKSANCMEELFTWKSENFAPVLAIMLSGIGFTCYWFIALSEKIKQQFFASDSADKSWISYIFFQKMMGVLFMGLLPALLVLATTDYSLADLGLKMGDWKQSLMYIIPMGLLIVFLNSIAAKKPESLATYPQMRIYDWTTKRFAINAFGWGSYLFAYEFLFRGILLMICVDAFGFWPAVAINLALYSATHIPKGLTETVGALPYGLLLCYVTVSTGSLAVAFFTHWIMSLSSDYFSIRYNPKMKFV